MSSRDPFSFSHPSLFQPIFDPLKDVLLRVCCLTNVMVYHITLRPRPARPPSYALARRACPPHTSPAQPPPRPSRPHPRCPACRWSGLGLGSGSGSGLGFGVGVGALPVDGLFQRREQLVHKDGLDGRKAVKSATLEATSSSTGGRGCDPTGRGPPWECRAARGPPGAP